MIDVHLQLPIPMPGAAEIAALSKPSSMCPKIISSHPEARQRLADEIERRGAPVPEVPPTALLHVFLEQLRERRAPVDEEADV